jgi:hypothetical protein
MTTRNNLRHNPTEFAAVLRSRGIDREDHEVLKFAVSWLPYDGPPDDEILVRFGLSKERYLQRLRQTVVDHLHRIHPDTAARLVKLCDAATTDPSEAARRHASQAVPQSAH